MSQPVEVKRSIDEGDELRPPPHVDTHKRLKAFAPGQYEKYTGVFLCSAFIVLEAAFAVLAFYCWLAPRELPYVDLKSTTLKSAFQTIFNLWHNIAIALAGSICAEAFSKEWAARRDAPTDTVSKVTSGMFDRAIYFFTSRATRTYRGAFAASTILILMRSTASSTIIMTSGVEWKEQMPIGLLSDVDLSTDLATPNVQGFVERLNRAGIVVKLEKLGGSPWGLSPQPNWLIPLPSALDNTTGQVWYPTDLAYFQHECRWQAPDRVNGTTYFIDGRPWLLKLNTFGDNSTRVGGGSTIRQLWPPDPIQNLTGTSAYLFLGGNATIPVNRTNLTDSYIDLSDLPALYDPSQFFAYHPVSPSIDWAAAPLASVLVCDPNITLTTGSAWVSPSTNITQPDVTVHDVGEVPPTNNIHLEAAHTLFSTSLFTASNVADDIVSEDAIDHINFNSIVSKMFMPEPPTGDWRNSSNVRPLSLDKINSVVDDYKLSALKAFTTGYRPESYIVRVQGVFSTPVSALHVDGRLALTASPTYALLHISLSTIEAALLLVIVRLNMTQERMPFDLSHVAKEE